MCQLFYGPLGDRIGKTRVMGERGTLLLGGSALCVAYLLIGLLRTWWLFIPGEHYQALQTTL